MYSPSNNKLNSLLSRQFLISTFILTISIFSGSLVAAQSAARIYSKEGVVQVRTAGRGEYSDAEAETILNYQDAIKTGADSRCALLMSDGVMVRLNENSTFVLGKKDSQETLSVEAGEAHFLSRKPTSFPTIRTPIVTASIRGTEFVVRSLALQSAILVLQGAVTAENDKGIVELGSGEQVDVAKGKAPQKSLIVNPTDAVQWALYYPSVFSVDDFPEFVSQSAKERATGLEALRAGDLATASQSYGGKTRLDDFASALIAANKGEANVAIALLDRQKKPATISEMLLHTSLDLSRGQVKKASAIHATLANAIGKLSSNDRSQYENFFQSQRAVIALVQNRKSEAREIGQRYLVNSDSSTAAIIQSYILQSGFDLSAALKVIEAALEKHPNSSLLRARNAELLLSFGESDRAIGQARRATAISSDAYTETILGFASLSELQPQQAKDAFAKAIKFSNGSGLPFLGMGLALIRSGDLAEGRKLIQQAAHLEPGVALYRSYLGKALFEQEEENLANEEYGRAMNLDPKDPTPYLYRAFSQISANKPVAALRDIEKSIELNDNRAVYRSRLMLDQDNAVRSGSLAQVYQQLGFSDLARTEAIRSLGQDYSNPSAHLLLSQSYDESFELTQASISEFLIARLLAPVNFNLARPSQSGSVSFNEYTALFDRTETRYAIQGKAQTNDRSAQPSALMSGAMEGLGYAFSYDAKYSDGYRQNDKLVEHIIYGSLQQQLSPRDTLLFDATADFYDSGDTNIGYFPGVNDPDSSQNLKDYVARIGFNHRFGPGSQMIGQILANDSDLTAKDKGFPRIVVGNFFSEGEPVDSSILFGEAIQKTQFRSRGLRGDWQYLYDSPEVSFVAGFGLLESSQWPKESGLTTFEDTLPETLFASDAENTEGSKRFFNYTTFHLAPWLDVQGGVSYSRLHLSGAPLSVPILDSTEIIEEWSPKAGFIMTPWSDTTVRGAFFESLGSSGIRELEVIEPTVVGGFNQTFFDFFPGTRSRNFALAVEHKLASETYLGIEGLHRHVIQHFPQTFDVLGIDSDSGAILSDSIVVTDKPDNHRDEDTLSGHVYQILSNSISATVDYSLTRDDETTDATISRTQKAKLGLNYFDPSGFLAFARGTWRRQQLDGFEDLPEDSQNGTRSFWLVDAGVGYRLPKRHGQVTLAATNIFDRSFRYLPLDSDTVFFPSLGARLEFSYNF